MTDRQNAEYRNVSIRDFVQEPLFCRGYADFSNGRGTPYEYDDWCKRDQSDYEQGRLTAADLLAHGFPIGVYRGWKSVCLLAYGTANKRERNTARDVLCKRRVAA